MSVSLWNVLVGGLSSKTIHFQQNIQGILKICYLLRRQTYKFHILNFPSSFFAKLCLTIWQEWHPITSLIRRGWARVGQHQWGADISPAKHGPACVKMTCDNPCLHNATMVTCYDTVPSNLPRATCYSEKLFWCVC